MTTLNEERAMAEERLRQSEADTPIELPVTALGEVAQLLREAQRNINAAYSISPLYTIGKAREALEQAGILVDVIIGDGQ